MHRVAVFVAIVSGRGVQCRCEGACVKSACVFRLYVHQLQYVHGRYVNINSRTIVKHYVGVSRARIQHEYQCVCVRSLRSCSVLYFIMIFTTTIAFGTVHACACV